MLARLRPVFTPFVEKAAFRLARLPAWFYTLSSVIAAGIYIVFAAYGYTVYALLALLVSGAMDAIDGAVARVRGEASARGALLDSFTDRVVDMMYGLGLIMLGFNPILVYLYTGFSLLVSYARARFESLSGGRSMEGVGVMERADRIIALAVVIALSEVSTTIGELGLTLLTILVGFTAFYRLAVGYRLLGR